MNGPEIVPPPPPPPEIRAKLPTAPAGAQPERQPVPDTGVAADQPPEPDTKVPAAALAQTEPVVEVPAEDIYENGDLVLDEATAAAARKQVPVERQAEAAAETLHQRTFEQWREGVVMVSNAVGSFDENGQFVPKDRQAIAAELGLDLANPQTEATVNRIVQALEDFWAAEQVEPDEQGVCHIITPDGQAKDVEYQHTVSPLLEALDLLSQETAPTADADDSQPQPTERAQRAGKIVDQLKSVKRGNENEGYWFDTREVDNSPELRQEIALNAAGVIENVVISMGGESDFHLGQLSRWANRLEEAIARDEGSIDSLVSLVTHSASEYMGAHVDQIQPTDELTQALLNLDRNLSYYREGNNDPLRQLLRDQLVAARVPTTKINEILSDRNIHIGTLVTLATSVDSDAIKLMRDPQNIDRLSSQLRQFVRSKILTGEEGGFLTDMLRGGILADVCTFLAQQVGVDPDKNKSIKDLLHRSVNQVLKRAKLALNQENRQAFVRLTNYNDEDIRALEKKFNLSGLLMKGMVAGMLLAMLQKALDFGVETAEPAGPR